MTGKDFCEAVKEIVTGDEIDKIINGDVYVTRKERRWLKRFKEEMRAAYEKEQTMYFIPLCMSIQSPALFRDIMVWLISKSVEERNDDNT